MPYLISSLIALLVCTILGGWLLPPVLTYILIGIVSIFMIGLILIQRGRGGGLAGAFGGVGGSSAFGTRAGDVFTRITIVTASVWIALNMGLVIKANTSSRQSQSAFRPPEAASGTGTPGDALPDLNLDDELDLGTSDLPPSPTPDGDEPAPESN